jgi:hypothetical protein
MSGYTWRALDCSKRPPAPTVFCSAWPDHDPDQLAIDQRNCARMLEDDGA